MTKRKEDARCRRCLRINDNNKSHPSGRRIAICLDCESAGRDSVDAGIEAREQGSYARLLKSIECAQCGRKFKARTYNQRLCGKQCRHLYLKQWRANRGPTITEPFPCEECGTLFLRNSGSHKLCSDECRHAVRSRKAMESDLRTRYRLNSGAFESLIESQGNRCAICGTEFRTRTTIHIDHNHNCCSGENTCGDCVRGLLCRRCNSMIGMAADDVDVLRKAIEYLTA